MRLSGWTSCENLNVMKVKLFLLIITSLALDRYASEYRRTEKLQATTLYATFNILDDAERAKEEGWQWMANFFGEPRAKLGHHFTIFGTPEIACDC
jgi:hypothetical protein